MTPFDPAPGLIAPDFEQLSLHLPARCLFAFLSETRLGAGCNVVDMEAAALAACARFRGKEFAQILFTADTLSSLSHDPRGWGYHGRNAALEIGLAAAQVM